ncbi:glycine zipper 2TM domain-containing protein [Paraherbaspirillum soli]|uniref:Glycine zipper 2TM domain-containing protein n=1 Tax=Paraherbaspirillum soli TaxID=631222 RepID=A0ABW0MAV4_9BURK
MDSPKPSNRIHPLVATAAVAVTMASLVGVAAITGLIPGANSSNPAPVAAMSAPAQGYNSNALPPNQPLPGPNSNYAQAPANYAQAPAPANYAQAPAPAPATRPNYTEEPRPQHAAQPAVCHTCGHVESVQAIQHAAKPSGVGIAAGAVLGGILGHQVGHGRGNTLATVAGAVGGGFAGNEVEKRTHTTTTYQVEVRMEDGKMRSFPSSQSEWRVGDPVRVVNGHLESRG